MFINTNASNQNTNSAELQFQQNNPTSSEDLLKHMQSLEKRIKSLEVTNRVILGVLIGTLVAAMTVGAGFAIAAAPIIAGSIVGGILATVALAALGATTYKYRAEIKSGFKYAAEKVVDGAKDLYGKVRDLGGKAKDSIGRKASNTALILSATLANAATETNYSDKLSNMTPEQKRQSQELRRMLKNNPELVKGVFSDMLSTANPEEQEFLKRLGSNGIYRVLTTTSTPKEQFLLNKILFESYGEIKKVIEECKTVYQDHILESSRNLHNNMLNSNAESKGSSLLFSSPKRKDSTQSNSSSVSDVSTTSSTVVLANPEEHKAPGLLSCAAQGVTGLFSSSKEGKEQKVSNVPYKVFLEGRSVGNSTFYTENPVNSAGQTATVGKKPSGKEPIPVAPPKVPESGSQKPDYVVIDIEGDAGYHSERSSPDSFTPTGRQSPVNLDPFGIVGVVTGLPNPLTPKRINLSSDDLNKSRLNKTGNMDKLVGQQPSTKVDGNVDAQPQTTPKSVV